MHVNAVSDSKDWPSASVGDPEDSPPLWQPRLSITCTGAAAGTCLLLSSLFQMINAVVRLFNPPGQRRCDGTATGRSGGKGCWERLRSDLPSANGSQTFGGCEDQRMDGREAAWVGGAATAPLLGHVRIS